MHYLLYYIIFGFVGIFLEFLYSVIGHNKLRNFPICGDTLIEYTNLCIPFLNIYGFGGLLLAVMANKYNKWNYFQFAIYMGIILTIMECIIGNISYKVNGVKKWNYGSNLCNGFISIEVFIFWIICSYLFRWFYYYIENK